MARPGGHRHGPVLSDAVLAGLRDDPHGTLGPKVRPAYAIAA